MPEGSEQFARMEKRLDDMGGAIDVLKQDVTLLKEDVGVLKQDVNVLKQDVGVLKQDVGILKEDVGILKEDVGILKQDVGVLRRDVGTLRVLYERHDEQIQTIAEVQAHHGARLEEHGTLLREIRDELAPLRDLRDFVRRVAENHEARLTTLERHVGL